MSLAAELERLADALDEHANAPPQLSFTAVAERIAKNLDVKAGEVAILGISHKWRHLYFIVPEALKNVGQVPLTSKSALAARTARESRPEIINDFAGIAHATVFESIKGANETGAAIQKIISAPILSGDKVVAVIQISRKGSSSASAGPDFTPNDLGKVLALCKPLSKLLQHAMTD